VRGGGPITARVFLSCWLLAVGLLLAAPPGHARPRPNLVLILADDLGYGELGVYGGRDIPTPNLDALARSGALFTDGYASAHNCSPSRAALLTGRYQQRFGHHHNPPHRRFGMPTSETTLAQVLRRRGYATGLVGKWHLGTRPEHHPLSRGFDEFFGFLDAIHRYFGEEPGLPLYRGRTVVREAQYLTRAFARESAAFVRRHAARPFFLFAAFNATHTPLQAEPAMLARFAHIADPKRRLFAAMLAHLDDAVGTIVRTLRSQGLARDTLVAFVTDNGCNTAASTCRNAPLRGGKGYLYEGGIRVPFLLSWPETIPPGRRVAHPVTARDLFPTFLAAATGAPYADARLDGVDLLPLARGATAEAPHGHLFWGAGGWGAVRKGAWKLLDLPSTPAQLYDLRRDRAERTNLAAIHPALVDELRRARVAWGKGLVPPLWPPG
jgi:arylsulfatase A-like enzyme